MMRDLFSLSMTRTNVIVCLEVLSELALIDWVEEEIRLVSNPKKQDFSSSKTVEEWNRFVDSLEIWRTQSLNGPVRNLVERWILS